MERFRENFELETSCKNVETAFRRFEKKFGKAWEVWGETLVYMAENGIAHMEEIDKDFGGWSLWLYQDEQFEWYYIAIVLTDETQKL